ncbi:MAG: type IX secretion system membrane protein PorP/SprF [Bacteroidales bacterium]|nr:type IX secretion system membrane protein PorP/SprF [Bacteroidales bacterium]
MSFECVEKQYIVLPVDRHQVRRQRLKLIVVSALVMLFAPCVKAQNEGQYTHFMFNRLSYNPAYAGSSGSISLTALYRNQWMGLTLQPTVLGEEAGTTPTNMLFSFDMPVSVLHGGLGLTVNSEKYGFHNNLNIDIDYAFRIFWGPGNLAAAIEANLYSYQFDKSNLHGSSDLSGRILDPTVTTTDPVLGGSESSFMIDFSTGLYYQVPSVYYVSLSVKNLLGSSNDDLGVKNVRTLYLMAGYEYNFPYNPSFTIKPSMLVKAAGFSAFQADVACLIDYENIFWGGLGYRWGDAFTFMGGLNFLKVMQVGIAYDLTTSRLGFGGGRSIGSAEIYLNASFQITIPKKAPSVNRNTRYLL